MDKRAAAQYIDKLFGKAQGYVAVAYKDKGESWQEGQFAWPQDRAKLLGWADVHSDANVFICPALRADAHTRKKGDGINLRWLWADVDWDKVPGDKVTEVKKRINSLGSYIVGSGSGDNVHVYVDLGETVDVSTHLRLNTGLRDYLFADNKQSDNSLLRLPGTTNWKTAAGSKVHPAGGHTKAVFPARLLTLRTFQRVSVMAMADSGPGGREWALIDTSGLPRRIRAMASMSTEEAVGRYGNRHKAVWAITGEMRKAGLDPDMIHSLMDKFPPAREKNAEEHGGYDVHKDVDRRLAMDQAVSEAVTIVADEADEDEMPEVSAEEVTQALIDEGVQRELLRRQIRKAADRAEGESTFSAPPDDVSWAVCDALNNPPSPTPYLIEGLAGAKHNVVITAQYKVGKTAFTMGTLAAALCDGEDFLGRFPVHTPAEGVVVGHWNCEMDPAEILNDYIRPVGLRNPHNLHVANLRGYSVNILTATGKAWAVEWLQSRQVKVWTIDSLARLARMAGVVEKDNDDMLSLLMAVDEIKVEADVDVSFIIAHTGRMEHEEGKERARGATVIDDWPDARWIMTKMDELRFLRVEGRGVAMDDTALHFSPDTMRSEAGFGNKADAKMNGAVQAVVKVVRQQPGITKTELKRVLPMGMRVADRHIQEAMDGGFIEVQEELVGRGGRAVQRHFLTGVEKPMGDRMRNGTPREVEIPPRGRRGVRSRT